MHLSTFGSYLIQMGVYQFQQGDDRKPLEEMVTVSFGILEDMAEKLFATYNSPDAAELLKLIIKIFLTAVDVNQSFIVVK